jgi:quinol monooxygenase YgiN
MTDMNRLKDIVDQNSLLYSSSSPEQSATGRLDSGREVVILFVKEFEAECRAVREDNCNRYRYTWFHNEEKNSFILHVVWENNTQIGIRFTSQHFPLLSYMAQPKDLILTTVPITELVNQARSRGDDHLAFPDTVLTFSQIVFEDPRSFYGEETKAPIS